MIRAEKHGYADLYSLYQSSEIFFPLIAAVLLDRQDGVVYVDDPTSPAQVYVEHAFGFAQIFGETVQQFEKKLESYFFESKLFSPSKVRLYAPYLPEFLASTKYEALRSYRQRFVLKAEDLILGEERGHGPDKRVSLALVDANNSSLIEDKFGVVGRFWRSQDDFVRQSNAVAVFYDGEPASICYSAAEADCRVEIDVLTLPEYRNLGLAKLAVTDFATRCFSLSLTPLWDCFTNNSGSMMLCKSVGFAASSAPYPFFTISKLMSNQQIANRKNG